MTVTDRSTNGTSLNGTRCAPACTVPPAAPGSLTAACALRLTKGQPAPLKGGDEIDFAGVLTVIFQLPAGAAAAAEPTPAQLAAAVASHMLAAAGDPAEPAAAAAAAAIPVAAVVAKDNYADHLTCGICQEILYKCVRCDRRQPRRVVASLPLHDLL